MSMLWQAKDVSKHYTRRAVFSSRSVQALDAVSLCVRKGEIVGLVGESGSGKSTLARIALGLEEPTSGAVYWEGVSYPAPQNRKALYRHVQCVLQSSAEACNPAWTGERVIEEPLVHLTAANREKRAMRVQEVARQVALPEECLRKKAGELSGGQQQRLCLARALAVNPSFLVLDEPTASLDVLLQYAIFTLLRELAQTSSVAMLLITHDLRAALSICDTIAVIRSGRTVVMAPAAELVQSPDAYVQRLLHSAGINTACSAK